MRRYLFLMLVTLLAACAQRGSVTVFADASGAGSVSPIYFATTRSPDPDTGFFGPGRSARLRYGRLDISIPPDRMAGDIHWPRQGRAPDARKDFFVVRSSEYQEKPDFRAALSRSLRDSPTAAGEVVVYVHGFNNTFAESAYRLAQLGHDLKAPAIGVVYAWPSLGKPLGYAYDRDSVLFARDGLETLLGQVADAGAKRIILVAHSVGTELTMEVLRQMTLDRNSRVLSRIGGVVLLSPDIDTQVFRRQAKRIGRLPQPFLIFTSGKDKALALSAALTGRDDRLGNVRDLEKLAELEVTVIDVSAFSQGGGHFNTGDSPTLLTMLAGLGDVVQSFVSAGNGPPRMLPGIVGTVQNVTQIVLQPAVNVLQGTAP